MAKSLTFRDFTAAILVKDEALQIYEPSSDHETKTATCYIASEPGETYTIKFKAERDVGSDYRAKICIDGPTQVSSISPGRSHALEWHRSRGAYISSNELRPYRFGMLELTDDPALLPSKNANAYLSSIRVEFYRTKPPTASKFNGNVTISSKAPKLHEKSKKAGHHATIYGDAQKAPTTWISMEPFSPADAKPYCTLVFKYRSIAWLMAEEIIPREPRIKRQRQDDESEDDDVEREEAELAALKLAIKARTESLAKRRKLKPFEIEETMVKKESVRGPTSRGRGTQGESDVIDLTEDQDDLEVIDLSESP